MLEKPIEDLTLSHTKKSHQATKRKLTLRQPPKERSLYSNCSAIFFSSFCYFPVLICAIFDVSFSTSFDLLVSYPLV